MNQPILVTYASRTGSTQGVAEAVAKTLAESGAAVEVRPMSEVKDLSLYRAVVAGSAIHGQKWLPEAVQFVKTHQVELNRKPFAAFLVCITLSMKNGQQYRDGVSTWLAPVRTLTRPVSEGLFAGGLDFRKMPLSLNAVLMRFMVLIGVWKTGDHRDWAAIRTWAEQTRSLLMQ